jgi:hypothetical protein
VSLNDWLRFGWLTEHKTTSGEIGELLGLVERDSLSAGFPSREGPSPSRPGAFPLSLLTRKLSRVGKDLSLLARELSPVGEALSLLARGLSRVGTDLSLLARELSPVGEDLSLLARGSPEWGKASTHSGEAR